MAVLTTVFLLLSASANAAIPVDLSGVHLASGVSGKGLASYPGLSMVFHHHEVKPAPAQLPRYLDLGFWAAENGIPFTQSSNLVHALEAALLRRKWTERFERLAAASAQLRPALRAAGFGIVAPDSHESPAVVTVELPAGTDSGLVGRLMEERGFVLSCHSGYLRRRTWIQACLMGEWEDDGLTRLPSALAESCAAARTPPPQRLA